jgi:hypothetical protein
VAGDDLETLEVVNVLSEKRNTYNRSRCDLIRQLGDIALFMTRHGEEVLEIAAQLVVGEWILAK